LDVGVLTDLGDVLLCQKKSLHERCRMGRHIVVRESEAIGERE
jgi:hypothetical protein